MEQNTQAIRQITQLKPITGINVPLIDESSPAFELLDSSGVLPHMARRFDRSQAQAIASESQIAGTAWVRDFLIGKSGFYLRADIIGRTGAGRVCKAIVERVGVLDAQLGQACGQALAEDGKDGLFDVLDSHLRRVALAEQAQGLREDIPVQSKNSYGRAM